MRIPRWLVVLLAILTAARLLALLRFELAPDEAYYALWAERLDLAYFSKGPGVALVIRLGTALFGHSELGVRFFSPWLALLTSLGLFAVTRDMYGARAAGWATVLLNALPIFNVGSILMTIDPLSIAAWTGGLATTWRALRAERGRLAWWLLTGVLLGAGFLSKYTNAAQLLGIVLFLAITPRRRPELVRGGFLACLTVFLLAALPPLLWNARHGWVTVTHLADRGGLDAAWGVRPAQLAEFVGGHLGVYSPILLVGLVAALPSALRRRGEESTRLLLCVSLPLIVGYALLSLNEAGEPNWTAPGMVGLTALAARHWQARSRERRWVRRWAGAGVALGAALFLVAFAAPPLPPRTDPSTRLRGWRASARAVEDVRRRVAERAGATPAVVADHYGLAAELAFYFEDRSPLEGGVPPATTVRAAEPRDQFWFWPSPWTEASTYGNRTVLHVSQRRPGDSPASRGAGGTPCPLEAELPIQRHDGAVIRTILVHRCPGFEGSPGSSDPNP